MSDTSEVLQVAALLDENLNGTNNSNNNTNIGQNGENGKNEQNGESKKRKSRSKSPKKSDSKRSRERSKEKKKDRRSRERSKDRNDKRSRERRDRRSRDRSKDRYDRRSRDRYDRRSRDRYDRRSRDRKSRERSKGRRSRDRNDKRSRERSKDRRSRDRNEKRRDKSKERRSKSKERKSRERSDEKEDSPKIERTQQYKDASTIFVSQLPIMASAKEVARFFEKVGKVRDVRLIPAEKGSRKSRGFGYVEFDNPEQANKAITELVKEKFQGRTLFIQSHVERMSTTTQKMMTNVVKNTQVSTEIPTRLFVGNFDPSITENDLRIALKPYGEIISIEHRDDDKGKHCLIMFKDPKAAEEAYHGINDKPIKGKMMKFGLAKEPTKNNNHQVHRNMSLVNSGERVTFTQKLYNPNALQKNNNNNNNNIVPVEYDTGLDKIDDDRGGVALNAKSRAILMSKLQRSDDFSSSSKSDLTSPCVILKNVFDPKEEEGTDWPKEIEEDVAQECGKYGKIVHCAVEPQSQGFVYLRFEASDFAKNAIRDLNGRWFGKRQIVAEIFPFSLYTKRFPN